MILVVAGFVVLIGISTLSFSADAKVEVTALPVSIGGSTYNLEILIAKIPSDKPLPLALITHGSAGGDYTSGDIRAESEMQTWAMDFAQRGYIAIAIVRRGYGRSDGEVAEDSGTCSKPNPEKYLSDHADDIEGVLRVVRKWPEVDASRTLAVGQSTGGAVMLAAAARPNSKISLVINVSGGLYRYENKSGPTPFNAFEGCDDFRKELIALFGRYGRETSAQSLWLYAENDPWFTPVLASELWKSWRGDRSDSELLLLPPSSIDGHRIFFEAASKRVLLPAIDAFLRRNSYPTWDDGRFDPLRRSLHENQLRDLNVYLSSGSDKALAISTKNTESLYYSTDRYTGYLAKRNALEECERANGKTCQIIAHNFDVN